MDCVEVISVRNIVVISYFLVKLGDEVFFMGRFFISRFIVYFIEVLVLRVIRFWFYIFYISILREFDWFDDELGVVVLRFLN